MKILYKKLAVISLIAVFGFSISACTKQDQSGKADGPIKKLTEKVTGGDEKEAADLQHADWVTFERENHKFSFKHPKEWLFVPEIDKESLFTGRLDREDPTQEKFIDEITGEPFTVVYTINMRVEDNPENLSAREHELSKYIPQGRAHIESKFTDVAFGGSQGIEIASQVTQVNTSGPVVEYLLAPGNGKVYRFVYVASAHKQTHNQFLGEFEQILSTLVFVD